MAGDGGEIRPFERKFDTARRVGRQLIKQIPPARIGLIRRDGAEPFLHVQHGNPAIPLYASLGFRERRRFVLTVLRPERQV